MRDALIDKSLYRCCIYSAAMLNISGAARFFFGLALLLIQAGLFALFCLAADAIGFFLCFAA
ncbi:TPA: hypothetical protein ACVWYC_006179, partial [Klebsiella pneumoniae]